MRPECFRKYSSKASIATQIFYFFRWKSRELMSFESVPPSYAKYRFQLISDGGAKNGSLTIRTQISLGNIFPISRDQ